MAYDSVYPWIGRRLQDSTRGLADDWFDGPIRSAIREALPPVVRPGQTPAEFYEAMAEEDREAFDEAIGNLVAADQHGPLSTGGAGGSLSSEGTETLKRAFAGAEAMREEWRARARMLLASLSFAPSLPSGGMGLPNRSMFAANGPSRQRCRDREYEE